MTLANELDPLLRTETIRIYDAEGFEGMRRAGRMAAECLDFITPFVVPGAVTDEIDARMREWVLDHGGLPACLGYRGYTKTTCISINHVVCHGIPGERALREGDIVNIDHGVVLDGWHGDTSRMFGVGAVGPRARRLVDVTYESLAAGLAEVKPGARFGDIGAAIQQVVERNRMSVVQDFCGHGVGRLFHDAPNVLHYGKRGTGAVMEPGMIFTIEPMVNLGKAGTKVLGDGWTAVTRDKSLSAQCEHSVGVTADGMEVFTLSPGGLFKPPMQAA